MKIELTEISVLPIKPKQGHLGFVSFVINNSFYIGNIALYSRFDGGYRLVYPEKIIKTGAKIPSFAPINKTVASEIETQVFNYYTNLLEKAGNKR